MKSFFILLAWAVTGLVGYYILDPTGNGAAFQERLETAWAECSAKGFIMRGPLWNDCVNQMIR